MKGLNFALLSSVFLLWFRSTLAFRLLHRGVGRLDRGLRRGQLPRAVAGRLGLVAEVDRVLERGDAL